MKTEQFILDLAVGGFCEPLSSKSASRASRLVVLADGTTAPVLLLLARRAFAKSFDEELQIPVWKDGDRTNETLANVSLRDRPSGRVKALKALKTGGREYMRVWRASHKAAGAASSRKYAEKRAELVRRVLGASPPSKE